mgnify:CR=1 FL=1
MAAMNNCGSCTGTRKLNISHKDQTIAVNHQHTFTQLIPKVLLEVRLEPVPNAFGFTDVDRRLPAIRIRSRQEIDSRSFSILSRDETVKLTPRPCDGLSGPVRQFGSTKPLRVAMDQKVLDRGARHPMPQPQIRQTVLPIASGTETRPPVQRPKHQPAK